MIINIVFLYLIILFISIPGFLKKAGIKFYYGLIPIVNIYFFFKALRINPILLIIYGLLLIFTPFKDLLATILVVFLPFLIMDAYEDNLIISFISLVVPFITFPVVAYYHGDYNYGGDEIELY